MLTQAVIRQYAVGQRIDTEVADQEIVLHYALALLHGAGLTGRRDSRIGPVLFKGGTALRKCIFESTGRFSQDVDFDVVEPNGFESEVERALGDANPYFGIRFTIDDFRYSQDGNFSADIGYEHPVGRGRFELQISYRRAGILEPRPLELQTQPYFRHVECGLPELFGLDPYEMIGEKIMACNRRLGGSGKDVYDLYLWAQRPFSPDLVRRLAVLKCWTDQRRNRPFVPEEFLDALVPANFRWTDLRGLIPRGLESDQERICSTARSRLQFLTDCTADERALLADHTAHREHPLFERLCDEARSSADTIPR
jgi:uncharacterized protein